MAITTGMYDGGSYPLSLIAAMFKSFVTDGYVKDIGAELAVSALSGMTVLIGTGRARLQGYWFEIPEGDVRTLTVTAADPLLPRIDRIVIQLSLTKPRKIIVMVKTGTPASVPSAPLLTRTPAIHELSLAEIAVAAATDNILSANITDERDFPESCGRSSCAWYTLAKIALNDNLDMGGKKIINLADPADITGLANKEYFDSVVTSTLGVNKFEIAPVFGAIPAGWLELNGQAVSRATYPGLFAEWGITYGNGDGSTTFNLPDHRGRLIYGGVTGLGTKAGSKTVTLSESQMPAHTHGSAYPGTPAIVAFTAFWPGTSGGYGGAIVTNGETIAGGSGPHNNLQSYITLRFMVRGT